MKKFRLVKTGKRWQFKRAKLPTGIAIWLGPFLLIWYSPAPATIPYRELKDFATVDPETFGWEKVSQLKYKKGRYSLLCLCSFWSITGDDLGSLARYQVPLTEEDLREWDRLS